MKTYRIILAVKFLALVAALTAYVCLGQVADPFGDPVQGDHTSADTELLLGAIHSQWSQEKHAILAGANPNIKDKGGEPLLNWHMRTDQSVDHLRFLIAHGADVNIKDSKFGITPLMLASEPESIDFLISAGANLKAKDNKGLTPLFHALKRWADLANGESESSVNSRVEKLLDKGANPNTTNLKGENALFYFVRMGHEYHKSCANCLEMNPFVIVRALVQAGVDPNGAVQIVNYSGSITLDAYSALYYPDVTMLKALLATGMHHDHLVSLPFFNNVETTCPECATYVKQAYPSARIFTPTPRVLVLHTVTGSLDVPAGQANGSSNPDCPPAKCGEVIVRGIETSTPTSGYSCCDIRVWVTDTFGGVPYECKKQPPYQEDNVVSWWDCGPNFASFDGPYTLEPDPSTNGKTGLVKVRFRNWKSRGQTATVQVTYSTD
jgi:hypothetical protein